MRQRREDGVETAGVLVWRHYCCCWHGQLVLGDVRHAVVLFPLHPSVLEPDLDLTLGQAELMSDLYAAPACQVAVEVKFFLEFERLMSRVWRARPFAIRTVCAVHPFSKHAHRWTDKLTYRPQHNTIQFEVKKCPVNCENEEPKWVYKISLVFNVGRHSEHVTSDDSLFQDLAAATGNAWSPIVKSGVKWYSQ